MNTPITGYYGCGCHPFASWEESTAAHSQVFDIDQPVRQRHTGRIGKVSEICKEAGPGWVIVKYGDKPCDHELEHVACLAPLPSASP